MPVSNGGIIKSNIYNYLNRACVQHVSEDQSEMSSDKASFGGLNWLLESYQNLPSIKPFTS